MKRRVNIVAPDESQIHKAFEGQEGELTWAYVGECVATFERCETWFRERGCRLDLGAEIQTVAQEYKQAYIDYIGALGLRFDSPRWWLSSVAEKNPYISKSFLRVCHILTVARLLQSAQFEMAVVVVEEACVRRVLPGYLRSLGWEVADELTPLADALRVLRDDLVPGLLRRVRFVLQHSARLVLARLLGSRRQSWREKSRLSSEKGLVLLHGWVDQRSFNREGRYRNVNLGELAQHLERRGWTCCLLPLVLPTVGYRWALRALLRSRTPFLLPHTWLTLPDILEAAVADVGLCPPRGAVPSFESIDLQPLMEADLRKDWAVARVPTNFLHCLTVRRWRSKGLPLAGFVYSYENHLWERGFCLGFRRAYPEARLVGYQDANVPDLCLNFYVSACEFERVPFPDVVVTNGAYSFSVLRRSGYPEERLRQGGAVRFEASVERAREVGDDSECGEEMNGVRQAVLVVPPSNLELASELIWKACRALGSDLALRVTIKCHPVLPFSRIERALGGLRLPPNFVVSELPFLELLLRSGVLLYMDSTTSLEALAHGVGIIHVGSEWSLDLDTIGIDCAERMRARTPAEIKAAVHAVLSMRGIELADRRRRGRELVRLFLGPAREHAYSPVAEVLLYEARCPATPNSLWAQPE